MNQFPVPDAMAEDLFAASALPACLRFAAHVLLRLERALQALVDVLELHVLVLLQLLPRLRGAPALERVSSCWHFSTDGLAMQRVLA